MSSKTDSKLEAPEMLFTNAFGAPDHNYLDRAIGQYSFRSFAKALSDERYWRQGKFGKFAPLGAMARKSEAAIEVIFALFWEAASCWTAGRSMNCALSEVQPPAELIKPDPSPLPCPINTPIHNARKAMLHEAVGSWEGRRDLVLAQSDEVLGLYLSCARADHLATGAESPHTSKAQLERAIAASRRPHASHHFALDSHRVVSEKL